MTLPTLADIPDYFYHTILPKKNSMLPEFMDGGEQYRPPRDHYPPGSYRNHKPYSAEDLKQIMKGICPRCKASLFEEVVICGGEKGVQLQCRSCARRYYPIADKVETFDFKTCDKKERGVPQKIWRDFHCKYCGTHRAGMFWRFQKYCPGTDCYERGTNRDKQCRRRLGREK